MKKAMETRRKKLAAMAVLAVLMTVMCLSGCDLTGTEGKAATVGDAVADDKVAGVENAQTEATDQKNVESGQTETLYDESAEGGQADAADGKSAEDDLTEETEKSEAQPGRTDSEALVETAWLRLLENEVISLGDSGECWNGDEDKLYSRAYGIYGGDTMTLVDVEVRTAMDGDQLRVNEDGYYIRWLTAPELLRMALRRAGEMYLEKEGALGESMAVQLYMTDLTMDDMYSEGTIVVLTQGSAPVELTVAAKRWAYVDTEFSVDIIGETVFEGSVDELDSLITVETEFSMSETSLWKNIGLEENTETNENPEQLLYGEFLEGQTKYYESDPRYPEVDYEGDGLNDRVFKSEEGDVYLMLSSGDMIWLDQQLSPDCGGRLECVDMDGDGIDETVYIRYHWSSSGSPHYMQMWQRTDQGLEKISFVCSWGQEFTLEDQIWVPLTLEKLDDTHMKIIEKESGISVVQEFVPDEYDHWGFKDGEYGPIDSAVDSDGIEILADQETGKTVLRMYGLVGDKWSSIYVKWEMICEDGVWKVTSFANGY